MSTHNVAQQPVFRPRISKRKRNTLLISFLALMALILFFVYIIVIVGAGLAAYYSIGNQFVARESKMGLFQSYVVDNPFKGLPVQGKVKVNKQYPFYSFSKAMMSKRVFWVKNTGNEMINQSTTLEEWDERVVELLRGGTTHHTAVEKKKLVRSQLEAARQLPFVKISLSRLLNSNEEIGASHEPALNRRKREATKSKLSLTLKKRSKPIRKWPAATGVPINVSSTKNMEGDGAFPDDIFTLEQRLKGAILLHFAGLIYMFVALAIVCDEFFVPALDVITKKMSISDDVAGATLMAAGGSAPEFFTSLFGVFITENNVGIGTIVGSATFNILCVLAFCTLFSKAALKLTWWPLFRDVSFYILALLFLVAFFMDEKIEWHEAMAMFTIYLIYAIFMKYNSIIEKKVKRRLKRKQNKVSPNLQLNGYCNRLDMPGRSSTTSCATTASTSTVGLPKSIPVLHSGSIFRTSIIHVALDLNFLPENDHPKILHKSNAVKLSSYSRNAHQSDNLKRQRSTDSLAHDLGPTSDSNQDRVFRLSKTCSYPALPKAKPSFESFTGNREQRSSLARDEAPGVSAIGHLTDSRQSSITASLSQSFWKQPDQTSSQTLENPATGIHQVGSNSQIEEPVDISWPINSFYKQCVYVAIAPIMIPLFYSLPDVKKPGRKKYAILSFFGSVLWIALFSYLMVWLANTIGLTLGISTEVMGLTILAAGTSIPDLITSVIVSRKGLGDMAVSSSIGSNMFDICIGLPIPWLLYFGVTSFRQSQFPGSITVESNGLLCSVSLLFFMLIVLVMSIGLARWQMNKTFGYIMLLSYMFFCSMSVLIEKNIFVCPLRAYCKS